MVGTPWVTSELVGVNLQHAGCPSSKAKLAFDFQLLQTLGKHIPVLRPEYQKSSSSWESANNFTRSTVIFGLPHAQQS